MSSINFDPDFVFRTRELLLEYDQNHIWEWKEFTLLINCALWIIVFIQERWKRKELKNSDDFLREKISNISELSFLHEIDYIRDKNLASFLEKLRNSIAHINIKSNNTDTNWESVELRDTCSRSITFTYHQLKTIIMYLADKYLEGNQ